jgi:hypothetical protein
MNHGNLVAFDPSAADYRATSPYEWGERHPYHLLV